jgi:hypothetical protein
MAENNVPILEADLGKNGGPIAFYSSEEIDGWMNVERQAWSWVISEANQDGNLNTLAQAYNNRWNAIQTPINNLKQPQGKANPKPLVEQIGVAIKAGYGPGGILHSSNTDAKWIEDVKQRMGARTAAYGLAIKVIVKNGGQLNTPNAASVSAVLESALYERGLNNNAETERAALEVLKNNWSTDFSSHRTRQDQLSQEFTTLKSNAETLISEHKKSFDETFQKNEIEFKRIDSETKKNLEDLQKSYEEHMSLKAPVKYWTTRSWFQFGTAIIWLGILGLLTGLVLQYDRANLDQILTVDKTTIPKIGYALLVITLFLWGVRILVRLFLNSVHGFNDARERATMVKTYLSLLKDGVAIKAEDRVFLLKTLFRPSSSGLVKDDAIPPFFEALAQVTNRK